MALPTFLYYINKKQNHAEFSTRQFGETLKELLNIIE